MRRLRLLALALALLTASIALGMQSTELDLWPKLALLIAAACLAIVSPFDAPDPGRRRIVVISCLVYLAFASAALVLAYRSGTSSSIMAVMLLLVFLGSVLSAWAFTTRKRRRMSSYHNYYDQ